MDNFRWYDWLLIGIFADFGAALVMAILSGSAPFGVMILPLWFLFGLCMRT